MAFGGGTGAAAARSRASFAKPDGRPIVDSRSTTFAANDGDFRELDCIRPLLSADVLAAAQERAARIGVGADRVLIASGTLTEDAYLRALADATGTAFEPLDGIPRTLCPIDDERLIESAAAGLLPLMIDGELYLVLSPRGTAARRIVALTQENPAWARRFRFTSAECLSRFILRCAGSALAARASDWLEQRWPELSAAPPSRLHHIAFPLAILGLLGLAAAAWAPSAAAFAFELILAALFLAWLGLRLAGAFIQPPEAKPSPALPDVELPVYTVIAALYREAASVDELLRAIERLDYPPEKLDVILAVEADDRETRAAIDVRKSRIPITVVAAPATGPRTKPKALNVALPFARGTFTVVYDAEDRPEPNQLRRALQAFRAAGEELGCVQARLCIDNTADSWLAGLFTAEYAGQFDVFLSGLAALQLPLPLGGTSNHFYTATLRKVGAWDSYNVTEDADLGIRLARFGYRSDMISSTTYEEAPARLGPWLRQRTRWLKGWMQTWAVHTRQPRRLKRDLGLAGFLTFQLIVGGSVLAALLHPLLMAGLIYSVLNEFALARDDSTAVIHMVILGGTVVIGYLTSAFIGWIGLRRRGLNGTAWVLLLTPVHWLLLSLAAWRALYQLADAPYAWEKTEHGLAKSSRLAVNMTRSLLQLERYLRSLKESGQLPTVPAAATDTSAVRRRRPRACD